MRFSKSRFVTLTAVCSLILLSPVAAGEHDGPPEVLDIGHRLELFVDDYLIEAMDGVKRELHHPRQAEKVFVFDQPWEGNTPFHVAIFKDGDIYRMYYRGTSDPDYLIREDLEPDEKIIPKHEKVSCYAESKDGIHWTRPSLGQVEFNGSKDNNILEIRGAAKLNPFKDANPKAPDSSRYKAVAFARVGEKPCARNSRGSRRCPTRGLVALESADGINWSWMAENPVITDGAFDSHNVAFWDDVRGLYVALYRDFERGVRTVKYATSSDFLDWSPGEWVDYGDSPSEHLYTTSTIPYFRAPHIYLAFPKRFIPWRSPQHSAAVRNSKPKLAGLSDVVFMSSRDGQHWYRFVEAFIRPGRNTRNWIHRTNFVARGIWASAADEITFYMVRHYTYPTAHVRRMVLRTDGFVSVNAGYPEGELVTRPLKFKGKNLRLNYSTSAAGSIQVEIQDANGHPLAGFGLQDSIPMWGDEIKGTASWRRGGDGDFEDQLARIRGSVVRLRFVMTDADIYSIQFE